MTYEKITHRFYIIQHFISLLWRPACNNSLFSFFCHSILWSHEKNGHDVESEITNLIQGSAPLTFSQRKVIFDLLNRLSGKDYINFLHETIDLFHENADLPESKIELVLFQIFWKCRTSSEIRIYFSYSIIKTSMSSPLKTRFSALKNLQTSQGQAGLASKL